MIIFKFVENHRDNTLLLAFLFSNQRYYWSRYRFDFRIFILQLSKNVFHSVMELQRYEDTF